MMKKALIPLSCLMALLCGLGVAFALFDAMHKIAYAGLDAKGWAFFSFLSFMASLSAIFIFSKEKKEPVAKSKEIPSIENLEEFEIESKLAMRGHLKLSIIFWILAYRKEKVKSFQDAKKEVFQELRKEMPHVRWIDSILEEIQSELSKGS